MGSHPTGSEELVYIRTPRVSVTVKGRALYPRAAVLGTEEKAACFGVSCREKPEEIRFLGEKKNPELERMAVKPVFYEQTPYELVVENLGKGEISFHHVNPAIRGSITPVGSGERLLSGVVNFGNDIGYSDFVICVDEQEYLRFTVEVFPEKISYRKDYLAIVADVTEELYSLIFDFLKKTYSGWGQQGKRQSSAVEFYGVICRIYEGYLQALDRIFRQPHHELQSVHRAVSGYKARRTDRKTMKWLERHPGCVMRRDGKIVARKVLALEKRSTSDTRENRLVRSMTDSTLRRLRRFRERVLLMGREENGEVTGRVDSMIERLEQRVQRSFLGNLKEISGGTGMSLVFSMAPGYRELYRYYLMLERGLDVSGDVFRMSVKDLAQLYEYWCFIKLNRLLKEKYQLVSQDIIRTEGSRLFVTLVKGKGSQVDYCNPLTGETIALRYNPARRDLPTVPQKPDNVLTLVKQSPDSGKMTCRYVFDAKYRIDPALPGSYYCSAISSRPGPREEDINTMHRYRDAIVCESGEEVFRRTMFGAYVLFPYGNEEEYSHHRFYQSIEKVNIGGLPFLPSATKLVERRLTELVDDSPETALAETVLPSGIEKKLAKVDWTRRDVLIGTLRNREQLKVSLENCFYHIPASRIQDENLPIHYVDLYQSKTLFGREAGIRYWGEVVRMERIKRREIREIPKESNEPYYRFTVKEWKSLDRFIGARELGPRVLLFTNLFLLLHSREVPDLLIRSEADFRMYMELRRLTGDRTGAGAGEPLCCRWQNCLLDGRGDKLRLIRDGKIVLAVEKRQFLRHPGRYFREMRVKAEGIAREQFL